MHTRTETVNHHVAVLLHPMYCIFSLFMLQTLAEYQESGEQFVLVSLSQMFNRAAAWQSVTPQMLQHLLVCVNFVFVCLKC